MCQAEKPFIVKLSVILKIMTSQPGKQTITVLILSNISRSKGNQTKKLGQLIKYKMTIIFHEKSYAKCGRETIPRPFYKKSKLSISLDQ